MTRHISRKTFDEVMAPVYAPSSIIPHKARASRIWDIEGREYIDLGGGIAVTALGHSHPELLRALHTQADQVWHLSNYFTNGPVLRLAQNWSMRLLQSAYFLPVPALKPTKRRLSSRAALRMIDLAPTNTKSSRSINPFMAVRC